MSGCTDDNIDLLAAQLPNAEYKFSKSIKQTQRMRQYVVSRHLINKCVKTVFDIDSETYTICYPKNSQPQIILDKQLGEISLSLSHSADWIGVAIGMNCQIGIDILDRSRPKNWHDIAHEYFHVNENKQLLAMKDEDARRAFQKLWCVKEAAFKALGGKLLKFLGGDFSGVLFDDRPIFLQGIHAQIIQQAAAFTLAVTTDNNTNYNRAKLEYQDVEIINPTLF